MKKSQALIWGIILFISIILIMSGRTRGPREIAHLSFPNQPNAELLVNGQKVLSESDRENQTILMPGSFSALQPNTISFGSSNSIVTIDKIKPDDFITIDTGEKIYQLNLFPIAMPRYKVKSKRVNPGYWFLTPFEGRCVFPSYG